MCFLSGGYTWGCSSPKNWLFDPSQNTYWIIQTYRGIQVWCPKYWTNWCIWWVFPKSLGYPHKLDGLQGKIPWTWMIWSYPHFNPHNKKVDWARDPTMIDSWDVANTFTNVSAETWFFSAGKIGFALNPGNEAGKAQLELSTTGAGPPKNFYGLFMSGKIPSFDSWMMKWGTWWFIPRIVSGL